MAMGLSASGHRRWWGGGLHSGKTGGLGGLLPDFLAVYFVLRDIDKVDELMADITEQQEVAQQISDAISQPVGFGDVVDEVIGSKGSGNMGESKRPARRKARENHGASLREKRDSKSGMFLEV